MHVSNADNSPRVPLNEADRRWAAREQLWKEAFEGLDLAGKTVLDAGTGEGHFTRALAALGPAKVVSITCRQEEIGPARERVAEFSDKVEFRIADLTAMPEVPDASFDLVGADFLIAAVASYRPYREIDCLRELKRVLRPGGRIVVTGWEVWPECRNRTEKTIRQLFGLREAAHRYLGRDPFREHPRFWIENRLVDLGLPPERFCEVPDIHHDFLWFVENTRKAIESLPHESIRLAFEGRLRELQDELLVDCALDFRFEFGRLHAVITCKLESTDVSSRIAREVLEWNG